MKNLNAMGWLVLAFSMTGCLVVEGEGGSGGAGSGGGADGGGGEGPAAGTQVFVLSRNLGVASFASAEDASGRVEVATFLNAGPDTGMYGPRDLEMDGQGTLYVASENDGSVVMYDGASDLTGVVSPSRRLAGTSTRIVAPVAVALDREEDVLYVVNSGAVGSNDTDILVFDGASKLDGDVAPSRVIEPDFEGFAPIALEFRDGVLYAVTQTTNASAVAVFEDARAADGIVEPARTIEPFGSAAALHVDDDGTMVVVDDGTSAYVLDAGETQARVFELEGASRLSGVHALSNGALLFTDGSLNVVFALDEGIPPSGGTVTPTRSFDAVEISLPGSLTSK